MVKFIILLIITGSFALRAQTTIKAFTEFENYSDTTAYGFEISGITFGNLDTIDISFDILLKDFSLLNDNFYAPVRIAGKFEQSVKIWDSNFYSEVDFSNSEFNDVLELSGVMFRTAPLFEGVRLPRAIALTNVNIDGATKIDFTSCYLNKGNDKCLLSLSNMRASKLIVPHHLFNIDTTIKDNNYEDIFISLMNNCRNAGLNKSSQDWDIELKKFITLRKYPRFGRFFNCINEEWWNFGYDKGLVFWKWMPLTFAFFVLINLVFLKRLLNHYRDEQVDNAFKKSNENVHDVIIKYRFMYALVYTSVIYFNFRLSLSAMRFKKNLAMGYIFTIYCVGNLHVLIGVGGYLLSFQNS